MRNVILPLLLLFLAAMALPASAAEQERRTVKKAKRGAAKLHYWLHVPSGDGPHPLLLFLHGMGERGDNLDLVRKHGPPKLLATGTKLPLRNMVVVSPQCPDDRHWQYEDLKPLLDEVLSEQRIDRSRIYITGLSMGGFGTWMMVEKEPNLFAAAVPICGGGNPKGARKLKGTPIWAFHGTDDKAVPLKRSEEMVEAIRKAGGGKVKLTVYPDTGHDSWTRTYLNPETYRWLLEHNRSSKK